MLHNVLISSKSVLANSEAIDKLFQTISNIYDTGEVPDDFIKSTL